MKAGKLIVISAPSGSGKTTLCDFLLKKIDHLNFSISATSRNPRANEINGKHYYFLSSLEFKNKIKKNEFIEYEQVYENLFYGTLNSELKRLWSLNKNILFDIDVKGGINLKKKFPENTLSIFIKPPSLKILEQRLELRNSESKTIIQSRINKAKKEILFSEKFDIVITNDNLEEAKKQLLKSVLNFI